MCYMCFITLARLGEVSNVLHTSAVFCIQQWISAHEVKRTLPQSRLVLWSDLCQEMEKQWSFFKTDLLSWRTRKSSGVKCHHGCLWQRVWIDGMEQHGSEIKGMRINECKETLRYSLSFTGGRHKLFHSRRLLISAHSTQPLITGLLPLESAQLKWDYVTQLTSSNSTH